MASAVNTGSINMPKMLRHLSHRTKQVRNLVFVRDAIKRKDVKTTGQTSATKGASTALAGPAVNFGYETNSSAAQSAGTDTAYHTNSPELILPGLKAIQSPITSRSGQHERSGHRITGACKFYMPSLDYIRALDNFSETAQFDEIETYDKLIDMERIIQNPADTTITTGSISTATSIATFADATPGYEVDRLQVTCSLGGTVSTYEEINEIHIGGYIGGSEAYLKWVGTARMRTTSGGNPTIVDLPVRNVSTGDTVQVWENGNNYTYTATVSNSFDIDKLIGDSNNDLSYIKVKSGNYDSFIFKDIYLYKSSEWRVESVKDYRDEYMEVGAVRVRGDRTSRRRAYG